MKRIPLKKQPRACASSRPTVVFPAPPTPMMMVSKTAALRLDDRKNFILVQLSLKK
jgi:hypothetical protein